MHKIKILAEIEDNRIFYKSKEIYGMNGGPIIIEKDGSFYVIGVNVGKS